MVKDNAADRIAIGDWDWLRCGVPSRDKLGLFLNEPRRRPLLPDRLAKENLQRVRS